LGGGDRGGGADTASGCTHVALLDTGSEAAPIALIGAALGDGSNMPDLTHLRAIAYGGGRMWAA
jgi:hypothetical protein